MSTKVLNGRQVRWYETLADYNFKIIYRTGKTNVKADALSRRSDLREGEGGELRIRNNIQLLDPAKAIGFPHLEIAATRSSTVSRRKLIAQNYSEQERETARALQSGWKQDHDGLI